MEILNISKEKGKAVLSLDASELVTICNALYNASVGEEKKTDYKLYGELMIARDISQYGHIDDFCFDSITECRSKVRNL